MVHYQDLVLPHTKQAHFLDMSLKNRITATAWEMVALGFISLGTEGALR